MFSLPLDWLALVSLMRSDRWLSVYLQGSTTVLTPDVAERALSDLQHHQENGFRQSDIRFILAGIGSEGRPYKFQPTKDAAIKLLKAPANGRIVVRDEHRELWSALLAKIDPTWFIGIRLRESMIRGDDVDQLLRRQTCANALLGPQDENGVWADNHAHAGGLLGPSLALLDLTTELAHPIDTGKWPRMPEFPLCSEGKPTFDQLPVLVNNLFFYLQNDVFGIKGEAPIWNASVTWIPVSQSVLRARLIPPVTPAQKLLCAVFDRSYSPQQRWLALVTGLLVHENGKTHVGWRYALCAFMHASNILRSAMIAAGVGLGNFRDFFGSSFRKGRNPMAYLETGIGHGFAPGVKTNLRLNMAMGDVIALSANLSQQHREFVHLGLHFSRSERRHKTSQREALHKHLAGEIEAVKKALWGWSGRRHEISLLDGTKNHVDLGRLVRVLDVAGEETQGPIELYAPAVRVLREMSGEQPGSKRMTLSIHAGEDYDHPVSGLRAIYETVDFCAMRDGDRLGHALALGLDARIWMARQGRSCISSGNYLDNITFMYHMATLMQAKHDTLVLAYPLEELSLQLYDWSSTLYGKPSAPHDLIQAWLWRRNSSFYNRDLQVCAVYPGKHWLPDGDELIRQTDSNAWHLWRNYCSGMHLESRDKNMLVVGPGQATLSCLKSEVVEFSDKEIALVDQIQDFLMEELNHLGITIEACPTSNIYVGRLTRISEHPVFRWVPPETTQLDPGPNGVNRHNLRSNPLSVCVNTDDPGLMPTSIAHEHWLLKRAAPSVAPQVLDKWGFDLQECGKKLFNDTHLAWSPSDNSLLPDLERDLGPRSI